MICINDSIPLVIAVSAIVHTPSYMSPRRSVSAVLRSLSCADMGYFPSVNTVLHHYIVYHITLSTYSMYTHTHIHIHMFTSTVVYVYHHMLGNFHGTKLSRFSRNT